MKILLIILGVIGGLFVLVVLGLIAASKRIETNTRKENARLESHYGLPEEQRRLHAYGAVLATALNLRASSTSKSRWTSFARDWSPLGKSRAGKTH